MSRQVKLPETPTAAVRAEIVQDRRGGWLKRAGIWVLANWGLLIVCILAWQFGAVAADNKFFPPPFAIAERFVEMLFGGTPETFWTTDALTIDVWGSVSRMLIGFALGTIFGILLGTAIGRSRVMRETVNPIIEFLRSIPATAVLPLFIILLGGNNGMRIAFIAYGVMWFIIINTAAGVSSVHKTPIEMGQIFKLSRAAVLWRIVLPAALPKIFAGLRIALTGSLLLSVVSEFVLAKDGIGLQLIIAQGRFMLLDMWAWMILLALIGFLANYILTLVENRVIRWHNESQASG